MDATDLQKKDSESSSHHFEDHQGATPSGPGALTQGDRALEIAQDRVVVTEEDSRRICRKTDLHVLTLLCWIYFLQILDKSVIGYSAVFGLKENAGLVGNQYSTIGSIGYFAQLGAQPLGAYLLVKLPVRYILPAIVFCWGCSLTGMAGATNFSGLAAARFFLGFFEATCLPLFSLITISWYRRSEQPMRVAAWYSTNGLATIFGSLLVWGLGHITSAKLYSYQIIFLVTGLVTVITGAALYWFIDNSVITARFLSPEDRIKGVERLRANQTGVENHEFKWRQVIELFLEIKTWLFVLMAVAVNIGASASNVFGPLILQGLAGFTPQYTTLLNMGFGAMQFTVILLSSWLAWRFKIKSIILAAFMVPVVIGAAILYAVPHTTGNTSVLLLGYYLLACLFSANPLLVSWIAANNAGQSKKAAVLCAYNAASSAGNIIGPYLFQANEAPLYLTGLKSVLAVFCILIGLIALQALNLTWLNKRKEHERVRNGKPAKLVDLSMVNRFDNSAEKEEGELGANAFLDLTDKENDEFIFLI